MPSTSQDGKWITSPDGKKSCVNTTGGRARMDDYIKNLGAAGEAAAETPRPSTNRELFPRSVAPTISLNLTPIQKRANQGRGTMTTESGIAAAAAAAAAAAEAASMLEKAFEEADKNDRPQHLAAAAPTTVQLHPLSEYHKQIKQTTKSTKPQHSNNQPNRNTAPQTLQNQQPLAQTLPKSTNTLQLANLKTLASAPPHLAQRLTFHSYAKTTPRYVKCALFWREQHLRISWRTSTCP
jgi:hypothetical protein